MKKSLLVLALLFSLVSFAQSPADKSFPPEELFALGSYYYPEQWDSSQWEPVSYTHLTLPTNREV